MSDTPARRSMPGTVGTAKEQPYTPGDWWWCSIGGWRPPWYPPFCGGWGIHDHCGWRAREVTDA